MRKRCMDCKNLLVSSVIKKTDELGRYAKIERAAFKCTLKDDPLWFKMITETMKLRKCPLYRRGEHQVELINEEEEEERTQLWKALSKIEGHKKPFIHLLLHDEFDTGNFLLRLYGRDEVGQITLQSGLFTVPQKLKKDFITKLWNDLRQYRHYIEESE